MKKHLLAVLTLIALSFPTAIFAQLEVSSFFGDHMILQREKPLPVWGKAAPGSEVKVSFRDATQTTVADDTKRWQVELPAQSVGEPARLEVHSGEEAAAFQDVLVGEVWVASGQSNMAWEVRRSNDAEAEIAAADFPQIRFLTVPRAFGPEPMDTINAKWNVCSPKTVGGFSAVAYHFGRKLWQELGVPIGLVSSSWGGTSAEPWTPLDVLEANPAYAVSVEDYHAKVKLLAENPNLREALDRKLEKWTEEITQLTDNPPKPEAEWFDAAKPIPSSSQVTAGKVFFEETDGMAQVRAGVELTEAQAKTSGTVLRLGKIDNYDVAWINGVEVGRTGREVEESTQHFREYAIPDGVLRAGTNVVVLQIIDWFRGAVFGQEVEHIEIVWPDGEAVALPAEWEMRVMVDVGNRPDTLERKVNHTGSFLYNGMIAPLMPAAIRGVIWYQGESNAARAADYHSLFSDMITAWRENWGRGFPFYFVQLANFSGREGWPELREAQRLTLGLPNTGMAVAIDIGDPADSHPRNKQDVGLRLALWALANTYGQTDLTYSGPLFREAKVEPDQVRIMFDHTDGGLRTTDGGKLLGFEIAGANGEFQPAEARIDGESIVATNPDLPNPVAIRYAWDINPEANLTNASGLPASPFRASAPSNLPK